MKICTQLPEITILYTKIDKAMKRISGSGAKGIPPGVIRGGYPAEQRRGYVKIISENPTPGVPLVDFAC